MAQSATQSSQPAASPLLAEFEKALIDVDAPGAEKLFKAGIKSTSPLEFMDDVMVPAIENIGSRWDEGKIALSQMFMATRISEKLVNDLPPPAPVREGQPKLAIFFILGLSRIGQDRRSIHATGEWL